MSVDIAGGQSRHNKPAPYASRWVMWGCFGGRAELRIWGSPVWVGTRHEIAVIAGTKASIASRWWRSSSPMSKPHHSHRRALASSGLGDRVCHERRENAGLLRRDIHPFGVTTSTNLSAEAEVSPGPGYVAGAVGCLRRDRRRRC